MMNYLILANQDTLISGNWIIAVIGAIGVAVATVLGRSAGQRAEQQKRTVNIAGQPVTITQASPNASQKEVSELKQDIDLRLSKIEQALTEERGIARTANGNLHARIDKSTEAMAELKGELHQVGANVSRLLDIAMNKRAAPQPRRPA